MSHHTANAQPSPHGSPVPGAGSPPPADMATVMMLNAQMQSAGKELEKKVAALEAEKASLLAQQAQRAAAAGSTHGHPKGPTPPEFHGTKTGGYEIDAWVRDMRVQFSFYGERVFPNDAAKVRHAAMFLKGRAAEWWEAEDKTSGVENSWDQFVERLRERYRPMQAAIVARERVRRLKQTGTVSAYADVFQKELTPIKDMSASDQVFNFVSGLSSVAVANKVREKEPKSLHEAMDIAVRAEVFLAAGRFGHQGFGGRHAGANLQHRDAAAVSVPMDVNALTWQEELQVDSPADATTSAAVEDAILPPALVAKMEAMVQHRVAAVLQGSSYGAAARTPYSGANDRVPGLKAIDIEKLRSEGRCFRCKQKGHTKRECPKGATPSGKLSFQ